MNPEHLRAYVEDPRIDPAAKLILIRKVLEPEWQGTLPPLPTLEELEAMGDEMNAEWRRTMARLLAEAQEYLASRKANVSSVDESSPQAVP